MTGARDDGSVIYLDGELVATADAKVSVFDHAFLYGDGVFETFRVVDGRVFRMEPHLDRLERSAAAIALDLPLPRDGIRRAILATIAANPWPMGFVKAIVSRGAGPEPLLEHAGLASRLVVIVRPSMPFFADGAAIRGVTAAIVGTRKTPFAALDPRIKSLNYLNMIRSRIEARGLGANESILLDERGRVVEGSIYNVVAIRGDRLVTPIDGCLEGITLETTLEAAARLGYDVRRADVYPYDLETADEAIFTSTAVGLLPVTRLNGRPIGAGRPGEAFRRLAAAYQEALFDASQGTPASLAGAVAASV